MSKTNKTNGTNVNIVNPGGMIRETAISMIHSVLEEGKMSHIVIRQSLDRWDEMYGDQEALRREKALIVRMAMGTVEKKITLDYVLNCYSRTKVDKMKPFIRSLLRMSVYQILFMPAIPDSAACNEAVKLAKKRGFSGLSSFINGVLRTIVRQKEHIPYPDENDDRFTAWEITYSVPRWILVLLEKENGREALEEILAALEKRQPVSYFRINTSRVGEEEVIQMLREENPFLQPERVKLAGHMLCMKETGNISRMKPFQKGYLQVQDISSALVGQLSGVKEGDFCMDLCAAPGGKTMHLADLLRGTGQVVAFDVTEEKTVLLRENVKRCGFHNVTVQKRDATIPVKDYQQKADVVLVDAPCSGLGVMARKPDLKYRVQPEDIETLSGIARKILACGAEYLKPGGTLLFSTCTMTDRENEENRQWLLEHFSMEPADLTSDLTEEMLEIGDNQRTAKEGYLKLMLSEQYDGFYICKLIKR